MLALDDEIFLSERIKLPNPSLTEISHSSFIFSILSFNDEFISNVQSIIFIFFEKTFLNFLN